MYIGAKYGGVVFLVFEILFAFKNSQISLLDHGLCTWGSKIELAQNIYASRGWFLVRYACMCTKFWWLTIP